MIYHTHVNYCANIINLNIYINYKKNIYILTTHLFFLFGNIRT